MTVIDLLVTIIVVTILVTIALGVTTYLAYKLRMARKPGEVEDQGPEARYFVRHEPPSDKQEPPTDVDASST
jgi:Tfp pilus assembly protein PilE